MKFLFEAAGEYYLFNDQVLEQAKVISLFVRDQHYRRIRKASLESTQYFEEGVILQRNDCNE